jgi:hypothetical protein
MPVEILDAYAVLAPWAPPEAWTLARAEAERRCRPTDRPLQVEAAVLAVALRARAAAEVPAGRAAQPLLTADLSPSATIAHLVLVGRALRRSPVVRATLRGVPAAR